MALTVAIDGRLQDGEPGGLQQMVIGIAAGLAAIADSDEDYRVLVPSTGHAWIAPYLSERVAAVPVATRVREGRMRRADVLLRRVRPIRSAVHRIAPWLGRMAIGVPVSDGTIERLGVDVVHFPLQAAFRTEVPSIYQPHDLQHVHLPHNFTPLQRKLRDRRFRELCDQAAIVVTMTRWGRDDLVRHLALPATRVAVVPGASVLTLYPPPDEADRAALHRRFALPYRFALYPAQTWPHKNHLRLIEAIALLRDRGVQVPLVLSGRNNDHIEAIVKRIGQLRLHDQVWLTGFLAPVEIRALYELATCLVFPSLFEGWGMPVIEAFDSGVPVVASDIPVVAEVAGGAALLVDPMDVTSIALGIEQVWTDDVARDDLVRKGSARASQLSWQDTARKCRALYRAVAERGVPSDEPLLQAMFD